MRERWILYAVLCMSKHAHSYVCMHVCVRTANCDAEGKAKQRPNYFEPVLVVVFVLLYEIVLDFAAESCFEIGYTLIPRSSEVEANEWVRWKLCPVNVNNNKLPALSLTTWSCSHALMCALCLTLVLSLSLQKLRHTIGNTALLLSFSRTTADKVRLGLATPRPVLPLRYTQIQCQGCPQTCTAPPPCPASYLLVVLSLSSHWVTLKERKGSSCFTARRNKNRLH